MEKQALYTSPQIEPHGGKMSSSGIAGLDDILNGGFPKTRLCLVEGDPGSGKTTLGLQFLLEGVRVGEAGLYVTLSETKDELLSVALSHGWSLDAVAIHELALSEETLSPKGHYTFFHPSEVELGETTKSVLEEVKRVKPVRVVFDSLSELRLLARDPLKYRRQILGLKQFFNGRNCTVLLLDDRTAPDGDLQLQSLAHGVLMLEQLAPLYGAERRRLRVIKMRGVKFRGGFHDFTIKKGGLEVYPRLIASEHQMAKDLSLYARATISSGINSLDQLLGGGLTRGTSTLITGPAGTGKSAFAVQQATAAAMQGERTAYFTFDESIATLLERSTGLGSKFSKYVESKVIDLRQIDPAELSPGEFVHVVKQAVEVGNAKVVVIDSLNGYLNAMPEKKFLIIQLHELLSFLGQKGVVTIFIVAQSGLMGSMVQTPVDVSYLADTVLLLRYFEAKGAVYKAISVLKKRSGKHEATIREYSLSPNGIYVGRPLEAFQGVLTGVPQILEHAGNVIVGEQGAN